MKPSLLNPKWVYVPSHSTDIGARFKKIIAAQKKAEAKPNVVPMKKVAK